MQFRLDWQWYLVLCFEHKYKELHAADIVVPVPQHTDSINQRGYNQSEEIAKVVCKQMELPLYLNLLIKTRDERMRGKSLPERKELAKGLYEVRTDLDGESILLIDDTFTSGSTLDECARVLIDRGARDVYAFVAGRDAPEY